MANVEDFITPGTDASSIASAGLLPGSPAQQAFSAEYNLVGIRTSEVIPATQPSSSNSVGVLDPVGGSSSDTSGGGQTIGPVSPSGNVQNGQTGYNTGTGWWLGTDGGVPKFSIGDGSTNYLTWDGSSLTVKGTLNATAINIPDTTTANSFHADSSGNTWWGANVASGYTAANAYVLNTGAAAFKNVQIGTTTRLFTVSSTGIFSFGDGSDGTATCDGSTAVAGMSLSGGNYTMTRDVYFTSLTINSGVTVFPAGYRIFCLDTLTVNGTINRNGNDGSAGTSSTGTGNQPGGVGGAALADGYLKGSVAGQTGGTGATGAANIPGTAGANTTNSIGSNGAAGGQGGQGQGSGATQGAGGAAGTATASNVKLIANWHLVVLLDVASSGSTVKFDNSAGSGSGAAGNAETTGNNSGGGGGGSGSAGGIIAIYARNITIGASGVITANGGKGGNGGSGFIFTGRNSGGGGGGGGGNGGQVILVYNMLTNNGSITVNGGTKGTGGAAGAGGTAGSDGSNGNAGTTRQFQLTM